MNVATQSGTRIFYCERCGLRIPPTDFANQRATLVNDSEALCAACAQRPEVPPQTPDVAPAHAPNAQPAAKVVRRPPSSHAHKSTAAPLPWKSALAGAVVFGALLGAVALSRSKPTEIVDEPKRDAEKKRDVVEARIPDRKAEVAPIKLAVPTPVAAPPVQAAIVRAPEPVRPVKPAAPADDYDPRKAVADSLLVQAKEFHQKNADDVYGYREKLQNLLDRYRSTAAGAEAAKLFAEIKLPEFDPGINPEPTADAEWAKATSILAKADPKKDALAGNWSSNNGALRSDHATWTKLALPYQLPEEYDMRLTFSREENYDCLVIVLTRHGKPFLFSIGSQNANVSFEGIKERRKDVIATKVIRSNLYSNSTRHQIVVQVRRGCLRGYLNGKLLVGCQVDDDGLSLKGELVMPQPNQIGLMTWDSVYEFQTLEILPIKGEGKFLR